MRNLFLLILAVAFLVSTSFYQRTDFRDNANKLALIIAVADYDKAQTGWNPISAENDIPLITGALQSLGFSPTNIKILKDSQASRAGIVSALKDLQSNAQLGDMIVIHISTHGQQLLDVDNDEIDGLDEAIVPFGAPVNQQYFERAMGSKVFYDGSLHLRDEDLGKLINGIRAKVGSNGHVLVIMDSCHSGTGTRGSARVRGGEPPFTPKEWKVKDQTANADEEGGLGFYSDNSLLRENQSNLSKFVVISGATAQELNYETKDDAGKSVGSLTYSVSKIFQSLQKGTTYRQLFANIQSEMAIKAPRQNPQIEGDIDFEIFGGKFIAQENYHSILSLNSTEIVINAGRLNGVHINALAVIEPKGTPKPNTEGKSLSKGRVVNVSNFEATIELEKPLTIRNPVDAWVFITSEYIPDNRVRVDLSKIVDASLKKALTSELSKLAMVQLVTSEPELEINQSNEVGAQTEIGIINTLFNSNLLQKPITNVDASQTSEICKNIIHNFAQGKMFRELHLFDPDFNVVLTRFIPLRRNAKLLRDSVDISMFKDQGGTIRIPEGASFFIEVQNKGTRQAYFNLIDIEPNGRINPLLPSVGSGGVFPPIIELVLGPGEIKILPYRIDIGPPYGKEVFKVIATGVPIDLASTINTKGVKRGNLSAIEKLLGDSFDVKYESRGGIVGQSEMGASTYEFVFNIVNR